MGWVVNATPWPPHPRERPGTHCIGGWLGLRDLLDRCRKSRPPPPGFDRRIIQPVASRYNDWAIPTPTDNQGAKYIRVTLLFSTLQKSQTHFPRRTSGREWNAFDWKNILLLIQSRVRLKLEGVLHRSNEVLDVTAEIWTGILPNMNEKRYRLNQLPRKRVTAQLTTIIKIRAATSQPSSSRQERNSLAEYCTTPM